MHTPTIRSNGHPLLRIWVVTSSVLFCFCALWSFAQPIGAASDEPAQLVKAASVARGEVLGQAESPKLLDQLPALDRTELNDCRIATGKSASACEEAVTVVTVPRSIANYNSSDCDKLYEEVPAGCGRGLQASSGETKATTYVGRYPPLYYAIVGLPSLAWNADAAVYLMRLLSGLLSALFLGLALALAAIWSRSTLLVLAVAVAVTPEVIIFGSVVNPSGLEMATSICVWTGGLILVLDRPSHPPPSLIGATAAATAVMVLARGLSPLWLVLIALFLIALAPRSVPVLVQSHKVQIALGVVALASVAAIAFIVWAHALAVYPIGQRVSAGNRFSALEIALGKTDSLVYAFVGGFGWNITSPPLEVMGLALVSMSAVLVLGLLTSLRRHAVVIVALVITSFVVPLALMVSQAQRDGVVWQARDGFPLYVGILLVAGAVAGGNDSVASAGVRGAHAVRRLAILLAICVVGVQFGDFVWALRRYTVGLGAVVNPFAHVPGGWNPPLPAIFMVIVAIVVASFYGWWIIRVSQHSRDIRIHRAHWAEDQSSVVRGESQPPD
jgi:Predicted membrane protein (DUF2142)